MKARELLLPAIALAIATSQMLPTDVVAFTLSGGSLGLDQRDFRVFNNFSDPPANDNTTEHPCFPGYTGATLAVWKAGVEWGSRLHGLGGGDPTQPGDLGSGGANFDFSFQGEAAAVGSTNDNTHSEIAGGGGGVYAFTETPISDGWRIRYFSDVTWDDGPGTDIDGVDLQSVATHEFGHALGLGHSNVAGATMNSTSGGPLALRSISPDDQAGVQAIYGAASLDKPVIAAVCVVAGILTIDGVGFAPAGNEVWFTPATPGGTGVPVKATGVVATAGGTRIVVALPGGPAGAGPGDVLVKVPGEAADDLSNAFPLDTRPGAWSDPVPYCSPAVPNSTGLPASIGWSGSISVFENDLVLQASDVPSFNSGIFIYSPDTAALPLGDGVLCVGNQTLGFILRLPPAPADASGTMTHALDIASPPSPLGQITPGSVWNFEAWFRDPQGPGGGFNFSDALAITFCL